MDDATLGRCWRDDAPERLLTRLAATPRFGGHPGEARAATHVAEALADAGLDAHQESFRMTRWTRGSTALSVGDRAFEAPALPYSPGGTVTAPLAEAGHGTPADCTGVADRVAVVSTATPPDVDRHVHRMEKCGHAADAGAAAVVFAADRPGQLPQTGALRFGDEGPVPTVAVSRETGGWLREYEGREASLTVEADTDRATSQNVRATLGPDTDEAVLLLAHYDAHDIGEGALDNGCGVAVLLGAVRALRGVAADLGCRVAVAATGCEEVGLLGAEALADAVDVGRLRAVVNVDGAGRHRNLRALTHTSEALGALAERVVDDAGHPVTVDPDPHPWSDHWPFLRAGVPALQLHSASPDDDGPWDRGWGHTRADTRDKVDPRVVRTHAALTALLVEALTHTRVDRVDPGTVRERLRAAGAEPGMRAAGVWPSAWD